MQVELERSWSMEHAVWATQEPEAEAGERPEVRYLHFQSSHFQLLPVMMIWWSQGAMQPFQKPMNNE